MNKDIFINMTYECEGSLIHNTLKKIILENAISDLDFSKLALQQSGSIVIDCLSNLEIFSLLGKLGAISCLSPEACLIRKEDRSLITIHLNDRETYKVVFYLVYGSDIKIVKEAEKSVKKILTPISKDVSSIDIRWYYSDGGRSNYSYVTEVIDDVVHDEAYPFIENLQTFIEAYLKGSEQVLILIGSTGTGKTRLIRHIIKEMANKRRVKAVRTEDITSRRSTDGALTVSYTTDVKVLERENIFIDLLSDDVGALIIEDIDFHLKSRKEGNTFMYKLLAASDGLISNMNRKIIVSTNLKNINDIDEALIRPGRCFDILSTRKLSFPESVELLNKLGSKRKIENKEYSLAEIYKLSRSDTINITSSPSTIGF